MCVCVCVRFVCVCVLCVCVCICVKLHGHILIHVQGCGGRDLCDGDMKKKYTLWQ